MSPITSDEAGEFYGGSGTFTSVRKLLKQGETKTIKLFDINKTTKSKFLIKGKDYAYQLSLACDGSNYLMTINSRDLIRQVMAALYPNGPDKPIVPCLAKFTRRAERKTHESEGVIERISTLSEAKPEEDEDVPF